MSYLVLARKYRPGSFASVSGQDHVTRTLANAIRRGKVAHAYIFSGPRGVGKTSIARIFAKALNCEKGPTTEPCTECVNCKEIAAGSSLAVREIDGASHNSVDNVRELIETFRSLPAPGSRYKVYIIDEVHMLSVSAFNALLKSLEEPPPNTVFMMATTELHKIPETVVSRCQKHELRALTVNEVETRLSQIAQAEKIAIDPQSLRMITRIAGGSMRDAQSLLDRVNSFCDGAITEQETALALGVVERGVLHSLVQAIIENNSQAALLAVSQVFSSGLDPAMFLSEFASYFRDLLVVRFGGENLALESGIPQAEVAELAKLAQIPAAADLQDLVHVAREGADQAMRSLHPRFAIEALVVRLATRVPIKDIQDLLGTVSARPLVAPAKVAAPAVRSAAPKTVPTANWTDFVKSLIGNGGSVLGEQLKRLSITRFEPGVLEAAGPDFSISYLQQPDNSSKLEAKLKEICGGERWQILLKKTVTSSKLEPGSILHSEVVEAQKSKELKAKSIRENPKVKGLLSAFPGSTLEE